MYKILSQHTTQPTKPVLPAKTDQPELPPSMARFLVYSSLDSPEVVEDTCDQ